LFDCLLQLDGSLQVLLDVHGFLLRADVHVCLLLLVFGVLFQEFVQLEEEVGVGVRHVLRLPLLHFFFLGTLAVPPSDKYLLFDPGSDALHRPLSIAEFDSLAPLGAWPEVDEGRETLDVVAPPQFVLHLAVDGQEFDDFGLAFLVVMITVVGDNLVPEGLESFAEMARLHEKLNHNVRVVQRRLAFELDQLAELLVALDMDAFHLLEPLDSFGVLLLW